MPNGIPKEAEVLIASGVRGEAIVRPGWISPDEIEILDRLSRHPEKYADAIYGRGEVIDIIDPKTGEVKGRRYSEPGLLTLHADAKENPLAGDDTMGLIDPFVMLAGPAVGYLIGAADERMGESDMYGAAIIGSVIKGMISPKSYFPPQQRKPEDIQILINLLKEIYGNLETLKKDIIPKLPKDLADEIQKYMRRDNLPNEPTSNGLKYVVDALERAYKETVPKDVYVGLFKAFLDDNKAYHIHKDLDLEQARNEIRIRTIREMRTAYESFESGIDDKNE
ncbi:MAG: hypothetical protein QXQ40_01825 [Candidatus Aenigmatarchaeota archaeon]